MNANQTHVCMELAKTGWTTSNVIASPDTQENSAKQVSA